MDVRAASTAAPAAAGASPADLRQAAEEFEAVFLTQLLTTMTKGLSGEGPLGSGESDPFKSMLNQEIARLISRSGGVGVADVILREMLKLQEVS